MLETSLNHIQNQWQVGFGDNKQRKKKKTDKDSDMSLLLVKGMN